MAYRKRMLTLAMEEYRNQLLRHSMIVTHLPRHRRNPPRAPELLRIHGYA